MSRLEPALAGAEPTAQAPASRSKALLFLVTHSSAGGAQGIWANLAEGFAARGHRVTLAALYPDRTVKGETGALAWRYAAPRRPRSPIGALALLKGLTRLVRDAAPDVIFTAMPAANIAAAVAVRLAGRKTKVVISHHSPVGTYNRALNMIDDWAGGLASVDAIVSVSDAVNASLERKPGAYKTKRMVIRNALPPRIEARLAALAAQRRAGACRRIVVATGRLAPQKNYPVLLSAAQRIADAEFWIIGDGPEAAKLHKLADERGVGARVKFIGHKPREDALALLAAGDVFVQPSLFEGHSLALIEAAKLGLPLVVSDAPSQLEGVRGPDGAACGLASPVHDSAALAANIERLLQDDAFFSIWSARAAALGASVRFDAMLDRYAALI